ncbi:MAG: hypothetical protein CMA41_05905 [Euryarchaeota archaeon]|jgi:hypothetical protein|nr:hypothetical protein [Euryarchaeota archaeon]MBF13902.1 hypothetical protein [Euryarchaeota archaeon]CAI8280614.1 MAG: Uncharacterised protein [Euryarchaeota archaeon UBA443]|tara:strand:+ start:306 stop:590 length:285 start_codon:yes stop_codon:yes gene_type:complete
MAKASRLLLLLATIGLFVLALIMLLNSDSELMAIPVIGVSILAGFGYMMFDADAPSKPNSTPGAIQDTHSRYSDEVHKQSLPDVTQSDYDIPIL